MSGGFELGLGVAGIVMAFKGAVDTVLWIESFRDDRKEGCGYLALRYHIEKTRLQIWGELCKINEDAILSHCTLSDKPEFIRKLVVQILGQIRELNMQADELVDKHNIDMPRIPSVDFNDGSRLSDMIRALLKVPAKTRGGFLWTLKRKAEFEGLVSKLKKLIDDLREISLRDGEPQLLAKALPSHVLLEINRPELLTILSDPKNELDRALALSATMKLLHQNPSQQDHAPESARPPSIITNKELKLLPDSSTIGILTRPDGAMLTVWIEWNTFAMEGRWTEYVDWIQKLGSLLERVSHPALRLPPCYGVYDDEAYELEHEAKRIGYVFGPPQSHTPHPYDSNLRDQPPETLHMLITRQREIRFPIPPLGDRFQLAFTLASAFSCFHAAGWLHKGLHSGNIVFLQPADERAISVTEPFITGFEYSRPQGEISQTRSPLENKHLQHYYHPNAHEGFTKQRDLYGLGVVLYEIGCWDLVVEQVSDRTRETLTNRAAWQTYMVNRRAPDLGWRMGTAYQKVVMTLLQGRLPSGDRIDGQLFVQQYMEKVLRPLSECRA